MLENKNKAEKHNFFFNWGAMRQVFPPHRQVPPWKESLASCTPRGPRPRSPSHPMNRAPPPSAAGNVHSFPTSSHEITKMLGVWGEEALPFHPFLASHGGGLKTTVLVSMCASCTAAAERVLLTGLWWDHAALGTPRSGLGISF